MYSIDTIEIKRLTENNSDSNQKRKHSKFKRGASIGRRATMAPFETSDLTADKEGKTRFVKQ